GLGHGHQDLNDPAAANAVLSKDNERIVANASLKQYNEITPENAASFHFHGNTDNYPINGIIAIPKDQKSGVILLGRLNNAEKTTQTLRPDKVIAELLATVFTVQQFVIAAIAVVGGATALLAVLVFLLSLRQRQQERNTLFKIGGSRAVITGMMAAEVITVLIASLLLAILLTSLVAAYGTDLIQLVLMN
ncbi:MAG: hypothetical protein ACR2QG_10375, partial [Gammaproteobacteria bacterium]